MLQIYKFGETSKLGLCPNCYLILNSSLLCNIRKILIFGSPTIHMCIYTKNQIIANLLFLKLFPTNPCLQ